MAISFWIGNAPAVAQISNGSIDTVDGTPADNVFTVTIGDQAISATGDTDVATTAAALVASLQASVHPYFAAATWTNPSAGNITGTADTAGVPFEATLSVSGVGSGTITDFADTTANAGPHDYATPANHSIGTVPASSDTIIFSDNGVDVLWGLDQGAKTGVALFVDQSYSGKMGLPYNVFTTSENGETTDATVEEYRKTYLDIDWSRCEIGRQVGIAVQQGATRLKLENQRGSASTTIIHNTASTSAETGLPVVRMLFGDANAAIIIKAAPGGFGIAMEPDETATVGTATVTATGAGTAVHLGAGVTITTFEQISGNNTLDTAATVTTIRVRGGVLETLGDDAVTTGDVHGGTWRANHTGTTTTFNLYGGELDGLGSAESRTWTTVNHLSESAVLRYDSNHVTITNLNGRMSCSGA